MFTCAVFLFLFMKGGVELLLIRGERGEKKKRKGVKK